MSAPPERESPRRRCRKLVKRGKVPSQPLLMPIAHTVAAQIEGLNVREFLTDATRMSKCLTALHQAIRVDAIVCFFDASSIAEAVGAQLDWGSYPPEVIAKPSQAIPENIADLLGNHARIQTGVDVLKRLRATITDEALFAVVITGPATLAEQISEDSDGASLELCGRIISETGRIFGEAGAHVIMIIEKAFPKAGYQEWQAALLPVINVARFYNALPVLVPIGMKHEQARQFSSEAPGNLLICADQALMDHKPAGQILAGQLSEWTVSNHGVSLLTTAGEIPPDSDIPELCTACQRIQRSPIFR